MVPKKTETMEVSALGRPFTLGMLYNALEHKLIPGVTLWDKTFLTDHTMETPHHSSDFHVSTSDSIDDKSFMLDIDASLKVSFMSGLIEVKGSAKYLNDNKKFHHQSRVTLQYKATTMFKQLTVTDLAGMDKEQVGIIKEGFATHVVTGILYGANAFFVFDSEKLDSSNTQEIHGNIEAVIKKIPNFDIEGKVDLQLTDKEKSVTDTLSCKFYGDFLLESNPATYEKAVETYINLPKLLGKSEENVVPLKVWLMPLSWLDSQAQQQVTELSLGLLEKVQNTLGDLHDLEKRCNECLHSDVVKSFPELFRKVDRFQKLCMEYTSTHKQKFAKHLTAIKAGEENEGELEQHLEDRSNSPFSQEKLAKWMDDTEREANVIISCVDMMKEADVKIVPNQSELDKKVLAAGVEDALCFVFTSLKTEEPYFDELRDYLNKTKVQDAGDQTDTAHDQWYYSNDVLASMREKARVFSDLAEALQKKKKFCFIIAAIANEKYEGASIYHYKNGILKTMDFSNPKVPSVDNITDKSALIWYFRPLTFDPDTAHGDLHLSEENTKATRRAPQSVPVLPQRFDIFPQVLCKEALTGRCYWEVEWSTSDNEDVVVGVCYQGLYRKGEDDMCRLGYNTMSWCLGHRFQPEICLYQQHNKKDHHLALPPTGCNRIGVYLDWCGGTLSYYKVSENNLFHIHTFHTKFTEPVYPAFMIWREHNYALLCQ
ncbi:stonustoxin subunit alpha-like [Pholidichthys leucotaenia]